MMGRDREALDGCDSVIVPSAIAVGLANRGWEKGLEKRSRLSALLSPVPSARDRGHPAWMVAETSASGLAGMRVQWRRCMICSV